MLRGLLKIILISCWLVARRNVTKGRFAPGTFLSGRCAGSRLSGQPTFRYRSLLKLNCIINASRTISDGLYGNLRPRERPWKFEKGLTNQPLSSRRSTSRCLPSLLPRPVLPPALTARSPSPPPPQSPTYLPCLAGRGIYTINSLICRAHVGFRR